MRIRHSTEKDFPRIMEIYAYARNFMAERLGFVKCGIIHVIEDNYPKYAYEKSF